MATFHMPFFVYSNSYKIQRHSLPYVIFCEEGKRCMRKYTMVDGRTINVSKSHVILSRRFSYCAPEDSLIMVLILFLCYLFFTSEGFGHIRVYIILFISDFVLLCLSLLCLNSIVFQSCCCEIISGWRTLSEGIEKYRD
jgi:hypothetical protein